MNQQDHWQGDHCPGRHCPDLGLVGWMRSGKDTVADYLVEHYGYRKMGFATALKAEVARGVGCLPEALNEEPLKSQVRRVLQVWGTEFRRGQDPDHWVKKAAANIYWQKTHGPAPLVFADVRFKNEIAMLRAEEFLIVHVDMPLCDVRDYFTGPDNGVTDEAFEAMLAHPSECEWQDVSATERLVSRRGDLDGLYEQAKALVEQHRR